MHIKKNYPKNHIFSNCGGRHEHFWGILWEKSRFYGKKSYFFPILGGGRAPGAPPPPEQVTSNDVMTMSAFKELTIRN
jgi:hypothetical protein